MQNIFLLLLSFFFLNTCFSQNAFYDAKRIYTWSKKSNNDSIKRLEVRLIDTLLNKYKIDDSVLIKSSGIILQISDDVNFIGISSQSDLTIFNKTLDFKDSLKVIETGRTDKERKAVRDLFILQRELHATSKLLKQTKEHIKSFPKDTLNWAQKTFAEKKGIIKKILEQIENLNSQNPNALRDTALNRDVLLNNDSIWFDSLFVNDVFYEKVFRSLKEHRFDFSSLFDEKKDQLLELFKGFTNTEIQKSIVGTVYNKQQDEISKQEEDFIKTQIAYSTQESKSGETEAYVTSSISDQNFPSQSEIIDALAIYIAKRFKQDLALTFVENFTKYMKDNLLAREMFPATFQMLSNLDPYSMPKIGSEWRNSVSKDLIAIPENLVRSSVVQKWVKDSQTVYYLSDGVVIGRYMAKKFSFPDMVRSLYLRNGINSNQESIAGDTLRAPYLQKALLITYIINEELYDTSKQKFWITPEEFYKMKPGELLIFKELIRNKYDVDFRKLFGMNPLALIDSAGFVQFRNKYTDLIALFKQFENSQVAAYLSNKQDGKLKDAFWDFQRLFLDFLLKEIKDNDAKQKIKTVQNLFYVYDYVSNKNFGAAINTGLEILDTLLQKKSPTNYLRAFVHGDIISKFDAESFNSSSVHLNAEFQKMETLSKMIYIISREQNTHNLNLSTIKTKFKSKFDFDLTTVFNEELLATICKSGYQPKIFDSLFNVIKQNISNLPDIPLKVQQSLKYMKFQIPNTGKDLKSYFELIENLLLHRSPQLISGFRKITGFVTDAAAAKNSQELSKVLEGYAQPPLSYKLTRKSIFSLDLNGYLGFQGGTEIRISEIQSTTQNLNDWAFVTGFTVPVGISLSWGGKNHNTSKIKNKLETGDRDERLFFINKRGNSTFLKGTSHTFFISLIDIAGPVAFRLGNDSAQGLPEKTKWSQILAPGFHYVYGLRNLPLCFTVGFQISPQLRSYSKIDAKPFTTARFQIGATYDLPLLNFYRRKPF